MRALAKQKNVKWEEPVSLVQYLTRIQFDFGALQLLADELKLLDAVEESYVTWNKRVATAELNRFLEAAVGQNPPPAISGGRVKLRYMTQPKARPPSFVLFGTRTGALPDAYTRYLVNGLRETFDLPGVPIRLAFREADNPYAKKKRKR